MEKQFEIIETLNGNFLINRFDLIGNFIMQTGNWEPHLYEFYSKVLSSEDTVIDAGANLGYHAIQFGFVRYIILYSRLRICFL